MLFRLRKGPVSGYTRKSRLGKIVRVSGYNRPDNETSQEWETEYTVPWAVPMVDPRPSKTERMSPEAFCKRMDGWQMSDQRLLWSGPDKSQELLARDYVVGEKTWRVGYDGNGKVTAAIAWRRRPGRGGTAEVCEYWEGGQAPTVKGPMATLLWSLTYDNAQIVSGKKQSETVDAIWKDLGTTAYDTALDKIRPGDGYPRHRIRRVQTNTLFDVPHSATDDAQEDQLSLFKSVIAPKVVTRNGKTFTVRGYTDKRTRKPEEQKTGRVRKPEEQKTGRVRKPEEPTPGRSGTEAAYKAKTKRPDGSTLYEYTEEHIEAAAKAKFSRAKRLSEARDELNAALTSEMARSDTPRDKVVAAVVMLMDRCQFRIGSEEYARKNKTYGVTTFRPEHVTVTGSSIRFAFTGKTGVAWDRTLEDPELAKFMKHLLRNADDKVFWCHTKGGGQGSVTASHVNSWLQRFGVTAKDFRTYHASNLCYEHLKALSRKPDEPALSKKEVAKRIKEAVKKTAEQLGHTPAVSRQSYILPEIIADFEANGGMLSKPLWDHVKSLSKSLKSFDYQGALADNETTREFDAYLNALGKKQHGSLLKSLSRLLKGRVRAHTRTLKSGKVTRVKAHQRKDRAKYSNHYWQTQSLGRAIPVGDEAPDDWPYNLSELEETAFREWCREEWEGMMAVSRLGGRAGEYADWDYIEKVRAMEKAMTRAEPYDGSLCRALANMTEDRYKEFASLTRGDTLTLRCMQSASADETFGDHWVEFHGGKPGNSVILRIQENRTGVDISRLSPYWQDEVLLRKGARYRVVSVSGGVDAPLEVTLDEISKTR